MQHCSTLHPGMQRSQAGSSVRKPSPHLLHPSNPSLQSSFTEYFHISWPHFLLEWNNPWFGGVRVLWNYTVRTSSIRRKYAKNESYVFTSWCCFWWWTSGFNSTLTKASQSWSARLCIIVIRTFRNLLFRWITFYLSSVFMIWFRWIDCKIIKTKFTSSKDLSCCYNTRKQ